MKNFLNFVKTKLKERLNLPFILQLIVAIATPIGMYVGLKLEDLTSWGVVFNAIKTAINTPVILIYIVVQVAMVFNNPTESKIPLIKDNDENK